jgi:hypothetical protein
MLIGFGVFLVLVFGLAWLGNRRRGAKPWELRQGRDPAGVLANRENALRQGSHPDGIFPF